TIGFARNHRNFRHGRLGVSKEKFRAVLDDAAVLLRNAGQKAGYVFESRDRNIEAIAETQEARAFDRAVDAQPAGEKRRLIDDDADGSSIESREANNDVRRIVSMHFKEVAIINNQIDYFANVIRLVRRFGNY